ncbi:acetylornithine deacetylase [Methylococcus sp. EFPC2]|uniref:acetylornithine deacetylase n=1 Tax=Methylococcus sp. EFPC2 TaxID=2812648 RepID=UPI00196843AA|nr:acetylornithine deacetylase [Methylococcus sp. EFPC2]QSA97046.1 acetylornithine deacetylase [Methylococcus sp. EFPC2]
MTTDFSDPLPLIRELIARPSVSCTDPHMDQSNRAVIELLADRLEACGFRVEVRDIDGRKANLVATLGGGEGQPDGLVLSGHTDTVPCDPELWRSDPFVATERDGRIYGLGSADMKSFFALSLAAASHFRAGDLRKPLVILATADEESSMSGARALAREQARLGRYCVIGEPTGLKPIRLHKGVMMESLTVRGRAGHSSDPALGANAIEGMWRVLGALQVWRAELQAAHRNEAFKVAGPTMNFGSIHGGDNPNRICAHCELHLDLRPLPGMNMERLREELRGKALGALLDQQGLSLEARALFDGLPPFETVADADLVRVCEDLTGQTAGSVAFGTEAPFLSALGLETLVLGPGNIEQAHQPDEYLELAQIPPAIAILRGLIERYCVAT